MTDPLPAYCTESGAPLVNATLASAAVSVCLGPPGPELAIMMEGTVERLRQVPGAARVGYAVDSETGQIFPPGAVIPADRTVFASVRITLPDAADGTARVLDSLAALSGNGWTLNVQPGVVPTLDLSLQAIRARPQDFVVPAGSVPHAFGAPDGRGVLVGVVDFGCDFAHPAFLDRDGHTRLLFLWDQNAPGDGRIPGVFRERVDIEAALTASDPYQSLQYWPDRNAYVPQTARRSEIVHGTHVLGVAAGTGTAECPPGVAPGAALAFVHIRPGALVSTGDPADVFDGVCAIFDRAAQLGMPAVVNLSLGANSGSHDGNTLYDCALDAVLGVSGRAIAVSAGNERIASLNVDGEVAAGKPVTLQWHFQPGDATPNTIRIFSKAEGGVALLQCSVSKGEEVLGGPIPPGHNATWLRSAGQAIGMLYSGLAPDRGPEPLHHIEIAIRPSGAEDRFTVLLSTDAAIPVPFDAWIDRDDRATASQSRFDVPEPITRSTLACTACGRRTVTVGAFVHRRPELPAAPFSSEGTTRDARKKPDVSAPGLDVLAAAAYGGRTAAGQAWRNPFAVRMSGSSVAAPHAAGVLALMLQLSPALAPGESARILRDTARQDGTVRDWDPQLGWGRVDCVAALHGVAP